jgi:uncharacterized protein
MVLPIISINDARRILYSKCGELIISLDLGKTKEKILVKEGFVTVRNNKVPIPDFSKVKDDVLYVVDENILKKAAMFSDDTQFYYKLFPTADWPTLMLSSTPMHRYINITPKKDTEIKINSVSPVKGMVLDTCCGLGYTAIMASKTADKVIVFERDLNVIHVASFNPYSEELFNNPKIELREEDVLEGISTFKNSTFDRVIHDPPTFKYSSDLYSKEFYKELYRVMKKDAILYHYSPSPHKTRGEEFHLRIVKNLKTVGFRDVDYSEKASGVRAVK